MPASGRPGVVSHPARRQGGKGTEPGEGSLIRNFANALMVAGAALALAGATVWTSSARDASGAGGPRMVVSPASQNVAPDAESVTVEILTQDVNNLGAFSFTLQFDNDVLEYVGLVDGGFLRSTGRTQQCIQPSRGPNGEPAADMANQYGGVTYGCSTFGLLQDNQGIPGPSGSGLLATLTFKPKAAGTGDVQFRAYPGDNVPFYWIRPSNADDNGDGGVTSLAPVEQCQGSECEGLGMDFDVQNGVVRVLGAGDPEPTGVPPTPTQVTKLPTPDLQATAQAVLGSSGGRLTPVAGSGNSGSGSGNSGSGAGSSGATPRAGTAAGAADGANGAGAPRAGYGPQQAPVNPWPGRAGGALALTGVFAIIAGVTVRRRVAS